MRLAHLATNNIIITRMTAVSGFKKAYSTVTAAFVNIQGLSAEKTALIGGVHGKTYKIFCDTDIDISEHDKLRDIDTDDEYKVKAGGVTKHMFGATDYYEVIVEKIN